MAYVGRPSHYQALLNEDKQVTLAHKRVVEVELVELILARTLVRWINTLLNPVNK